MVKKRKKQTRRTLTEWIDQVNSRGMAGTLYSNDDTEKRWVEQIVCNEFQNSMAISESTKLSNFEFPLNDPPDFVFQSKGERMTGEATELINSDFHRDFSRSKKNGTQYSAHFGKGFIDSQWTEVLFKNRLAECVERKDVKYQRRLGAFDVLLIYSGEHWLLPSDVTQWIKRLKFIKPKSFNTNGLII